MYRHTDCREDARNLSKPTNTPIAGVVNVAAEWTDKVSKVPTDRAETGSVVVQGRLWVWRPTTSSRWRRYPGR